MYEIAMLMLCGTSVVALAMQIAANVALCRMGISEEEAEDEPRW